MTSLGVKIKVGLPFPQAEMMGGETEDAKQVKGKKILSVIITAEIMD